MVNLIYIKIRINFWLRLINRKLVCLSFADAVNVIIWNRKDTEGSNLTYDSYTKIVYLYQFLDRNRQSGVCFYFCFWTLQLFCSVEHLNISKESVHPKSLYRSMWIHVSEYDNSKTKRHSGKKLCIWRLQINQKTVTIFRLFP